MYEKSGLIDQLKSVLPNGSEATLLAKDGSVTANVVRQLDFLPRNATHIVVSSGGNDALQVRPSFESAISVGDFVNLLVLAQETFSKHYRLLLTAAEKAQKPTIVCTIYDSVPDLEKWERTALSIFNDVIIREASAFRFPLIDLRTLCNEASDYSKKSSIEPSSKGGMKIAVKIASIVQTFDFTAPKTVFL